MSDLLTERLEQYIDGPAPEAPDITTIIAAAQRALGRRHTRRVAAAVTGIAVLASAVGVAITRTGGPARPATITASPAPNQDEPLTWAYWEVSDTPSGYVNRNGHAAFQTYFPGASWYGNGRDTIVSDGTPAQPNVYAVNKNTKRYSAAHWQQVWAAPRDTDGLRRWLTQHDPEPATSPDSQAYLEEIGIEDMLKEPAPTSLRLALITLLGTYPRTTVTQGVDADGKPAVITSFQQNNDHTPTEVAYTDPTTGKLLETASVANQEVGPQALPAGHLENQDLYDINGPVTVVPAVTGKSTNTIPPNTSGTPTCTPGKPGDPSKANSVALAKLCLPDPAVGFPKRSTPDTFGDNIGRSFSVATTGKPAETILLQVASNDQYFLSLASSPTPKNGDVGQDVYVGSRTVLGVKASEVKDGTSGDLGLVLERDGFGIEAMGGAGVTYDQLAALTDQLQGLD